jgi:hypothetical protein
MDLLVEVDLLVEIDLLAEEAAVDLARPEPRPLEPP